MGFSSTTKIVKVALANAKPPAPYASGSTHSTVTNGLSTEFKIQEHSIENVRPIKVICIGAGYSGIYMGIRIPQRLKNVELVIYEKNEDLGGTWWENRYPGLACDIPAHCYQYSFEPNPEWSQFYAEGREIWKYLKGVTQKYSVERFVRLRHKVVKCEWKPGEGIWEVEVEKLNENGEVIEKIVDKGQMLVNARGFLNVPKFPDIPASSSEPKFKGSVVHSGNWPEGERFPGKRVAVIGTGSSGIQIVPSLQQDVARLDLYVRDRTWVSTSFVDIDMGEEGRKHSKNSNFKYTKDDIRRFKSNPKYFLEYRKKLEKELNGVHGVTHLASEIQKGAVAAFTQLMKTHLASRPDIYERLLPDFPVACRRLTPGPGYLESLSKENVNFISTGIKRITETGIEDFEGNVREVDAIVCATGFQTSAAPPFPIIGVNSVTLEERWSPYPEAYLSMTCDGFPNHFSMLGPNASAGSGSLTIIIERIGDYIIKAIRKLQKENLKSIEVKTEIVRNWSEYIDHYFERTVFKGDCRSWYRLNGDGDRITGLWPGSTLHAVEALENPRWEDFNYEVVGDEQVKRMNRLAWLGNGWTDLERDGKDRSYYLDPEIVDVPLAPFPDKVWETQVFYH
ncbi:cyclohexanone monooxygenase [Kalaharituber pfeilii]|nr:cyclohexanone monooxygenase [Kalaharituber pfeilii]